MAAAPQLELDRSPDPQDATLAAVLAERRTGLVQSLSWATDIATALREMHRFGLAYGGLGTDRVLVREASASLSCHPGLARVSSGRQDVADFGVLLRELVGAWEPDEVRGEIRDRALSVAERCASGEASMLRVEIELRLLTMRARLEMAGARAHEIAYASGHRTPDRQIASAWVVKST